MRRGSKKNRLFDYWLGIPLLNLLATARPKRKVPREFRRVGVMCSPALGDTLLFSGQLLDLRKHFDLQLEPVEIVHFCMRQNLAAAELLRGADRRVLIDLTRPGATLELMRAEHLDALLDFTAWQRLTAFYTMFSGARFTAGFRTAGMYRGRAYDLAVEHRNDRHELQNFRALVEALGIATGSEPEVEIPQSAGAEPLAEVRDLVVFHLWASGQQSWLREWAEERWIELAKRLARPETVFAITGAPSDLPRTEPFVSRMRGAGLFAEAFVGTDGFKSLARMLQRARLLVSVNTGVMHLAAIVGTPTLALNGPTNGRRWGPVGRCTKGVAPADGSGEFLNLGFEFEGRPDNVMERISVDEAAAGAEALLARCGETSLAGRR